MKKTISLLLTVLMALSIVTVAGTASAVSVAKVNGVECKVGATVTYTYDLQAPGIAENFQGKLTYTSGLTPVEIKLSETAGSVVENASISGAYYYNGSNATGVYDFTSTKTLITAKFTVTDIAEQTISNTLEIVTGEDGTVYKDYENDVNLCTEKETVVADVIPVTSVKLNRSATTITAGKTEVLQATVTPSYATNTDVVWTSSDESVATVTQNDETKATVTAVSAGTAEITAQSGDAKAVCTVTVKNPGVLATAVAITPASATIKVGQSKALTATITPDNATTKDVAWTSSNTSVATVTSAGVVKAVKAGTAVITATTTDGSNISTTATIKVTQPVTGVKLSVSKGTVIKGGSLTIKATVTPSNASNKKVKWSTSNSKIATVTQAGKVSGKAIGTVKITAKAQDGSGKSATATIKVTQPVTKIAIKNGKKVVTNGTVKLKRNASTKLTAVVSPSKAANKKVTWTSSNKKIVSVTAKGQVKVAKNAKVGKKVVITAKAKDGSNKSAKCKVQVIK